MCKYIYQYDRCFRCWCVASMHDSMTRKHYWIVCSLRGESIGHHILLTMNQKCRALIYPLLWAWINCWANSRVAGDLTRRLCDVTPIPHYWPFVTEPSNIYFTHKGPVMLNLDVVFDVSLTKLLNKQSKCRWFETPWRSNDIIELTTWH